MRCSHCLAPMTLQNGVMHCETCGTAFEPVSATTGLVPGISSVGETAGLLGKRVGGTRTAMGRLRIPAWSGWIAGLAVSFLAGFMIHDALPGDRAGSAPVKTTLAERPAPDLLNRDQVKAVAIVGTQLQDNLLSLAVGPDGTEHVLYRASGSGVRLARLSAGRVRLDRELARFDEAGFVRFVIGPGDNRYIVAAFRDRIVLERVGGDGKAYWQNERAVAEMAEPSILAMGDRVVVAGQGREAGQVTLATLSADADILWQRSFQSFGGEAIYLAPGPGQSILMGVVETEDTTGAVPGTGVGTVAVRKLDPTGQVAWIYTLDLPAGGTLAGLAASGDDGAFVMMSGVESWLARIDAAGELAWIRKLPLAAQGDLLRLASNQAGHAVIAASVPSGAMGSDVWVGEFGPGGDLVAEAAPGIAGDAAATALVIDRDGTPVIAGPMAGSVPAQTDLLLARLVLQPVLSASAPDVSPPATSGPPAEKPPAPHLEPAPQVRVPDAPASEPEPARNVAGAPDELPASAAAVTAAPEPAPEPVPATAPETAPAPDVADRTVRFTCEFKCAATGAPAVTYPIREAFVSEGPATESEISTLAVSAMDRVCVGSGGQAVRTQLPVCTAN